MLLPNEIRKAESLNPTRLLIYSHPKQGKTTALSVLPNCLLIDLQGGARFVDGLVVDIVKIAAETGKSKLAVLREVYQELKDRPEKYDYIALDPATDLENLASQLATIRYKTTTMGKSFTGKDVVKELDRGAGYAFLREAFEELVEMFAEQAGKCFILTAHVKLASSGKSDGALDIKDIDLTGKLKAYVTRSFDSVGLLSRTGNQVHLSFETAEGEDDINTGGRSPHLRNKKVLLTEEVDGKIVSHWDSIFLNG